MNKTIFGVVVLFLHASSFAQKANNNRTTGGNIINKSVKARIDSTLKSLIDSGKIAGASALIFEKNKETYFNAFGYADREAKISMDRSTIVRIYSMTKPVTGVALMKLYERGAFQLDDPLSKYAPEFADMKVFKGVDSAGNMILEPVKRPITIRDITRHTAGFAPGTEIPGLRELVRKTDPMNFNTTLNEMAKRLATLPLAFQPGSQWSYGISVDVQAYLVEQISGKPFDLFVKENILDPLGMTKTRYVVPETDRKKLAATYRRSDDGTLTRVPNDTNDFNAKGWPLKPGGFGLTSTVDDYMKFAQMLVNEGTLGKATILKPETVRLMATNHLSDTITQRMWLPSKGQVGFGIDFAVRLRPPVTAEENNGIVGEFFWDGAASTLFWIDPVNDLTAILFVQIVPFDRKLHKSFKDAVYGKYVPQ